MLQRFLQPEVLASIAHLDLIAKTVVNGFVAGLHRSPDFGFSQEFAEYRSYTPGDDLRHVDWNVFARSERVFLKRFRGETNCTLTLLLDASNSMRLATKGVSKIDYARFTAASLAYMAIGQRDATGLIVFDDEIRDAIKPSTRQGQLHRILHSIEHAEPAARTDYAKPFAHFQDLVKRRGIVVVISDFYEDPEVIVKTVAPLRFQGNDVILFHVLDPAELQPDITQPVILVDMETKESLEVSPEYVRGEYKVKIDGHVESLRTGCKNAGLDYCLMVTDRPLDGVLREYLAVRQGRF